MKNKIPTPEQLKVMWHLQNILKLALEENGKQTYIKTQEDVNLQALKLKEEAQEPLFKKQDQNPSSSSPTEEKAKSPEK